MKLETSARQSLLLPPIRIRLATPDMVGPPTLYLFHTNTKDVAGRSAAPDMPCRTSRLWTCHVFTTRDSQRLSAPNLSRISQLSGCHVLLSSFKIVATDRRSRVTASCSQHHNKTHFQMRSRDENDQRMSHLLSSQEPAHLSADFQRTTATGGDRLTGNRCRDLIFAVGRRERRVAIITM